MRSKVWFYPLSVYVAAAVLFTIGCGEGDKNKRVQIKAPIKNGKPGPNGDGSGTDENGLRTSGAGGGKGDPQLNRQEVKSLYEKIEAPAVKATAVSTAEQINSEVAKLKNGDLVAAEDITEGIYEISQVSIGNQYESPKRGVRTLLIAKTSDLEFKNVESTLLTTAAATAEKNKNIGQGEKQAEVTDRNGKTRLSKEEIARRKEENLRRRGESRQSRQQTAETRDTANDDKITRIFSYNFAFGRNLKVAKKADVSTLDELNIAQVNAYLHVDARESKLTFTNRDVSPTTGETPKTFKELLGESKPQADGSYILKNTDTGAEIIVAFRQNKETGDLQIALTEAHSGTKSKSKAYKSIVVNYVRKGSATPAPKKEEEKSGNTEIGKAIEDKIEIKREQ